jgi:hypothetical protein
MVRKFEFWDLIGPCSTTGGRVPRRRRAGPQERRDQGLPRRRRVPRDGRPGHRVRAQHQLGDQHRHGAAIGRTSRARPTPTASSSRCTRRPSRAPTSCGSSPRACAARAAASGCRRTARTSARREIPEKERYYFLEERYPKYRNLVPRDIASREIFRTVVHDGAYSAEGRRTAAYLDVTHLCKTRRPRCARSSRACWRSTRSSRGRPLREPDEGLPRGALLDGRPVGRLREGRATGRSSPARRATSRPTSPGSTRSARSTTSTTAPTASAPTRCCRASTAAW